MVGGEGRCEGISANPYDGYDVTLTNATLSGNFYKHAWIHVVTLFYSCHTEIQEGFWVTNEEISISDHSCVISLRSGEVWIHIVKEKDM